MDIEEIEQENASKPPGDPVFEKMRKDFIDRYSYHWSKDKMPEALDRLLDHIRHNR